MAKEQITKPEEEALGAALSKTENFFEQNSKHVVAVLVGLLVLAALIFGYKKLIVEPRLAKAADLLAEAQMRFTGDDTDYQLALDGDANGAGFLEIADNYGSTPSGNLAAQYAGICFLKLGDLENAAKYLKMYSPVKGLPGAVINAQNYGLQGDIAVAQQDYAAAVKLFEKAVDAADNIVTAPLYLRKAGLAAQAAGDTAKAAAIFQQILDRYPASNEAREVEKLLGNN